MGEQTAPVLNVSPQVQALLDLSGDIERASDEQRWQDALQLDQQRYRLLRQLPPQLFAATGSDNHNALQSMLESIRELETRIAEARDDSGNQRREVTRGRRAVGSYESIRHV